MFISKVYVNVSDELVKGKLQDSNNWHKLVMSGFNDYFSNDITSLREKYGILFRVEEQISGVTVYVQSSVQPNWYGKSWVSSANVNDLSGILESLSDGALVKFNLLCTPYYADKDTGKISCFTSTEDKINWLKVKGQYNGFELTSCEIVPCDKMLCNIGGNPNVNLRMTNLVGTMSITDAIKFRSFVLKGVGRQKAYGAGMLILLGY